MQTPRKPPLMLSCNLKPPKPTNIRPLQRTTTTTTTTLTPPSPTPRRASNPTVSFREGSPISTVPRQQVHDNSPIARSVSTFSADATPRRGSLPALSPRALSPVSRQQVHDNSPVTRSFSAVARQQVHDGSPIVRTVSTATHQQVHDNSPITRSCSTVKFQQVHDNSPIVRTVSSAALQQVHENTPVARRRSLCWPPSPPKSSNRAQNGSMSVSAPPNTVLPFIPGCSPKTKSPEHQGLAAGVAPLQLNFDADTFIDEVDGKVDGDICTMTLEEAGLTMIKQLGHGNHSTVHLVGSVGGQWCVKRFAKASKSGEKESVQKEYDIMQKVGWHPRVLEAFNLFQDASFFYIQMPFCPGGDFVELRQRAIAADVPITETWWSNIFKGCIEALAHLHAHEISHCDVKEPNLLVKSSDLSEPEIVLADFGIAQKSDDKQTSVIYGTPGYIAPEVWDSKHWTPQGDMFSLGVVMAQMLLDRRGIFIEDAKNFKEIKHATQTREPSLDLICQRNLKRLTTSMLAKNPENRPSAAQALADKWLDGSDDVELKMTLIEDHIAQPIKRKESDFMSGSTTELDSQSLSSTCSDC